MFILVITSITSCRKEDPAAVDPTKISPPIFSFTGEINGVPIVLQAGVNNYHITHSKATDENGVMEFISEFKIKNCIENCPSTLRVKFKDYREESGSYFLPDNLLYNGFYSFAMPSGAPVSFDKTFIGGLVNKSAKAYIWDFGDGSALVSTNTSLITHKYSAPGVYNVTLSVSDSAQTCVSTISNEVKLGQVGNNLTVDFYTASVSGKTVNLLSSISGGLSPYNYLWDMGDGNTYTNIAASHTYANGGIYLASLKVTDAAGNISIHKANIPVQNSIDCAAYFLPSTTTPNISAKNLSTVVVEWIDASGTLWTSNNDGQDAGLSKFEIISIEKFSINDVGVSAKKIVSKISCKLFNGSSTITLTNATATIILGF
jgi:hypothetical protein